MGLCFVRRRHLKMLQRPDDRFSVGVKQGFPVGTVIEEKLFTLVAGAKVAPQQRQDPIFRFDLSAQYAAQVGKADKAFQQVDLAVEVADSPQHGIQRFIGKVPQKARSLPQQFYHQPVQIQFLVRQAGKETFLQQLGCVGRTLYNFSIDTVGVFPVCENMTGRK